MLWFQLFLPEAGPRWTFALRFQLRLSEVV